MRIIAMVLLVTLVGMQMGGDLFMERYIYKDSNTQTITTNPLMGFAVRGDFAEDIGDNTLVYIEVLWKDIEPQKGVYDFSTLKQEFHIEKFRKEGKKAVLRFICDLPGNEAHMDIPQWLYEETKDGSIYNTSYGQGYSPNYANAVFMEAHALALQAIAEEFLEDHFLAYVELGSLGHWGEWHVMPNAGIVPLPTEEIATVYVAQYVKAFPEVRLLMRRPFLGVKAFGLGVYNDMLGNRYDTDEWLGWLQHGGSYSEPADTYTLYGNTNFYQQGAVGGEFTSGVSWEQLLLAQWEDTLDMIEASHMTFIGPNVPHELLVPAYQEQADAMRARLGYRLGISRASIQYSKFFDKLRITCNWNNQGIAPMYYNWPVYLYFYGEQGVLLAKEQVTMDLTKLMPQEAMLVSWSGKVDWEEVMGIGIGIEDPNLQIPSVSLNNATNTGKVTMLYTK